MAAWDDIAALAAELDDLQAEDPNQKRLNDSCTIEIVNQLIKRRYLKLIFTLNGVEYTTENRLCFDIGTSIRKMGRCTRDDLQTALNVDSVHISRLLPSIIASSSDEIFELSGEIMTRTHVDQLADYVSDYVEQRKCVRIENLMRQMDLPLELLHLVLKHPSCKAKLSSEHRDRVFVPGFIELQSWMLVGALQAKTVPVDLEKICSKMGIDRMVKCPPGALPGSFSADNFYVPSVYTTKLKQLATDRLNRDGFIDSGILKRLTKYVESGFVQNLTKFESCLMSIEHLRLLIETVLDLVCSDKAIDLCDYLPGCFTPNDHANFVENLNSVVYIASNNAHIVLNCEFAVELQLCLNEFCDQTANRLIEFGHGVGDKVVCDENDVHRFLISHNTIFSRIANSDDSIGRLIVEHFLNSFVKTALTKTVETRIVEAELKRKQEKEAAFEQSQLLGAMYNEIRVASIGIPAFSDLLSGYEDQLFLEKYEEYLYEKVCRNLIDYVVEKKGNLDSLVLAYRTNKPNISAFLDAIKQPLTGIYAIDDLMDAEADKRVQKQVLYAIRERLKTNLLGETDSKRVVSLAATMILMAKLWIFVLFPFELDFANVVVHVLKGVLNDETYRIVCDCVKYLQMDEDAKELVEKIRKVGINPKKHLILD